MDNDFEHSAFGSRADLLGLLAEQPLFGGLPEATLAALADSVEWLSLPGGALLFEAGEPPDSMYLVVSGGLAAYAPGEPPRLLSRIQAGECVGEMGLLSGHPRSARVLAVRDTVLARLARETFDRLSLSHPDLLLRISRLLVARLESVSRHGGAPAARSFALVPQSIEVDVGAFGAEFVAALRRFGRAELVWSVRGAEHTSGWFHEIEHANDFVVYVADPFASPWTRLCMRQSDALLLLARAEAQPGPWPALPPPGSEELAKLLRGRGELVLMHSGPLEHGAATRWRRTLSGTPHHHARHAEDVARIARLVTGRAVGLVLSGGGARGFAHIGVVRALREAGVPIDLVGGTSMGAILGAGIAAEWSHEELVERFHRTFVATNPLSDYTLPIVSLVSGRKVTRLLRGEFGELCIEDLPLPFYAVSANLTNGRSAVHVQGPIWRWLRASVAIPGVLPPVFFAGQVHVDGATINNLPVDVMRGMGRGTIIGVDVGAGTTFTSDVDEIDLPPLWKMLEWFRRRRGRPGILQILMRAGTIGSDATNALARGDTDLLFQPPLANVDLLHWRAFHRVIETGYQYARGRLALLPSHTLARLIAPGAAGAP
jgi:NTE family protein